MNLGRRLKLIFKAKLDNLPKVYFLYIYNASYFTTNDDFKSDLRSNNIKKNIYVTLIEVSRGEGAQSVSVNATVCKFDFQPKKCIISISSVRILNLLLD